MTTELNDDFSFKDIPRASLKSNWISEKIEKGYIYTMQGILKHYQDHNEIPLGYMQNTRIQRIHGCPHCPYWNTSFCYHGLKAPKKHTNGVCKERLFEVVEYAILGKSVKGKEIRRQEMVETFRKHIILLDTNLADYRTKRLAERNENDELSDADKAKFDDYEMGIMGQIEKLSGIVAEHDRQDIVEENKLKEFQKNTGRQINVQELNMFLNQSAKKLAVDDKKKELADKYSKDGAAKNDGIE